MTDPPLISIFAMAVAKTRKARLINWLQDIFPEVASELGNNPLPRWFDRAVREIRNSTLHAACANVVLGERMREFLERTGVPAAKISVIENWADDNPETVAGAQSRLRTRLALAGNFVVGYSGNLGRAHEFQTLLDAAALLGADNNITFLMIGGGAGMTALRQAVGRRGLSNFQFVPYQPRSSLFDSLAAADVHWVSLLPALEGLIVPSKLYGILAAGRAVIFIGAADGEIARVIESAQAGVTVAVGDAGELVRQISELKSNSSLRKSMGCNGLKLHREKFTPQRALARWGEILGQPGPSHHPPAD